MLATRIRKPIKLATEMATTNQVKPYGPTKNFSSQLYSVPITP
jgi:hypothetical protein